ncbi:MAG: DNA polymerase I [Acidobacteriota bacterium]|nr:DNA polymerase I [Acidobacteriota bacterium]
MSEKKLYLIDGNSLFYRAFYAIRSLSTSKGFPTNAIYGFIQMLRKLLEEQKPCYLGIVFDTKGPTIRHEAFKDYKAHRKPMPDDLVIQLPVLKNVIKALNIPFFEQDKYEADDVLASIAQKALAENIPSVIVTTDKDLLQLVNSKITIFNPVKDMHLDIQKVIDTFGVSPSQIVDVLALWGDPTDNIPGVPGIGEKTAKALIQQFGSLDNLLENLDKIKNPRLKENIKNNVDRLSLSRQLVTIEKNLELPFSLEALSLSAPNEKELLALFQELEFSSLLAEHMKNKDHPPEQYETIWTESQLKSVITQIKQTKQVSIDTETDSPFPTRARLVGMSFSVKSNHAYYLPLRHDYLGAPKQLSIKTAFNLLSEVMADPAIKKFGQNIKYDLIVLKREGMPIQGIDLDSMILSYLLEPNWGKHNLNRLALHYLHVKAIPYHDIVGKGKNELTMNQIEIQRVAPYACQDADLAFQLSTLLWKKIQDKKLDSLYQDIERPIIEVLAHMETSGVKIDADALKALSLELKEKLSRLKESIFAISGVKFNVNSPQQLAQILFGKLQLPTFGKTKATQWYSTNFTVLQELAKTYPVAQYALEYRQLAKLKSTYADSLPLLINPETGRIHTSYNQTVTATGRLSSSDPNLQNIPVRGELGQRCRQAFIPEQGHIFLSADYSQIELRVLAHLSEDPALIETFLHDRDIHLETATRVFGDTSSLFPDEQRRRAKIINFSIIYGATAFSLAKELGTSTSEAQKFIDLYFEKHPKVKDFLDQCVKEARENGYSKTLFGRQRQVPELKHKNKMAQQAGRRIALNTPIQGTAADLIKKAMIDIWNEMKKRKLKSKMILQVHDELVFEVPENEKGMLEHIVQEKMEKVFPLRVPLKVHLGWGNNWAEAK